MNKLNITRPDYGLSEKFSVIIELKSFHLCKCMLFAEWQCYYIFVFVAFFKRLGEKQI